MSKNSFLTTAKYLNASVGEAREALCKTLANAILHEMREELEQNVHFKNTFRKYFFSGVVEDPITDERMFSDLMGKMIRRYIDQVVAVPCATEDDLKRLQKENVTDVLCRFMVSNTYAHESTQFTTMWQDILAAYIKDNTQAQATTSTYKLILESVSDKKSLHSYTSATEWFELNVAPEYLPLHTKEEEILRFSSKEKSRKHPKPTSSYTYLLEPIEEEEIDGISSSSSFVKTQPYLEGIEEEKTNTTSTHDRFTKAELTRKNNSIVKGEQSADFYL